MSWCSRPMSVEFCSSSSFRRLPAALPLDPRWRPMAPMVLTAVHCLAAHHAGRRVGSPSVIRSDRAAVFPPLLPCPPGELPHLLQRGRRRWVGWRRRCSPPLRLPHAPSPPPTGARNPPPSPPEGLPAHSAVALHHWAHSRIQRCDGQGILQEYHDRAAGPPADCRLPGLCGRASIPSLRNMRRLVDRQAGRAPARPQRAISARDNKARAEKKARGMHPGSRRAVESILWIRSGAVVDESVQFR